MSDPDPLGGPGTNEKPQDYEGGESELCEDGEDELPPEVKVEAHYDKGESDEDWVPEPRSKRKRGKVQYYDEPEGEDNSDLMEVKKEELQGDDVEDDEAIGDDSTCESCHKSFRGKAGLLKHIGHIRKCKDFYGDRLESMRSDRKKQMRKKSLASTAEKDRSKRMSNYYNNREEKLKKQKAYYQKNKDKITGKKRKTYLVDKVDAPNAKKKSLVPEPSEPHGKLNINSSDVVPPEKCFQNKLVAGQSKIDHDDEEGDLLTLDEGVHLTGRFISQSELELAESFVGMTLSNDGESIELKYLMHRSNITLVAMQEVFHAVMSVTETDAKTLISEKVSPMHIIEGNEIYKLRNMLTKEIMANNNEMPDPKKPSCLPCETAETHFISEDMEEIPNEQLLLNPNLDPIDFAAVGVHIRPRGNVKESIFLPIFTVNMEDWRMYSKYFYTILINWVGGKTSLHDIIMRLPCGKNAKELMLQEIREDCYLNLAQPKTVEVCETCGQRFEYNKYLFSERNRFKHHVESHQLKCKICGEEFPTMTQRKFHQKTHNKHFVRCTKGTCKWIGTTESSLATHIKFNHTPVLCDVCGKEFTCRNSVALHAAAAHKPPDVIHECDICGKTYGSRPVLQKHKKRHSKADSLVNKRMKNGVGGGGRGEVELGEIKYMCTLHETCQKFFDSPDLLKEHLKMFAGREYPDNGLVPTNSALGMPPWVGDHTASKEKKKKKKKKKSKKKEKEKDLKDFSNPSSTGAHYPLAGLLTESCEAPQSNSHPSMSHSSSYPTITYDRPAQIPGHPSSSLHPPQMNNRPTTSHPPQAYLGSHVPEPEEIPRFYNHGYIPSGAVTAQHVANAQVHAVAAAAAAHAHHLKRREAQSPN